MPENSPLIGCRTWMGMPLHPSLTCSLAVHHEHRSQTAKVTDRWMGASWEIERDRRQSKVCATLVESEQANTVHRRSLCPFASEPPRAWVRKLVADGPSDSGDGWPWSVERFTARVTKQQQPSSPAPRLRVDPGPSRLSFSGTSRTELKSDGVARPHSPA